MMVASGIMLLLLLVVTGRLVQLQWKQHEGLFLQAEENRMEMVPELPLRGEILDRHGVVLAQNRVSYRLSLIPERVEHLSATLDFLGAQLAWSTRQRQLIARRIRHHRPDRPVLLQDKLIWSRAAPIASRQYHWPGIEIEASSYRYYPFSKQTSHLIGYLALANRHDLHQGVHSGELVGRSGVERAFERQLHGTAGYRQEEVDARGRRVRILSREPSQVGKPVRLSIDIVLQQAASAALGSRTGAVAVLDVHSGEVLALLSKPGYNTNLFITGLEQARWNQWLADPSKPLLNRAIQAAYPPASTMKLITALAGFRFHAPLVHSTTVCKGFLTLADRKLRCWKHRGHGRIGITRAIIESCDVFFYRLGDQLGMAHLSVTARDWGLGERTGIELFGEVKGHIPGANPHHIREQRRWYRGEIMISAIGQGSVTTTPLQMARVAATIANGGKLLRLTLLANQPPQIERQIVVQGDTLQTIRQAMRHVVSSWSGTGHRALSQAKLATAGKTGTAQVVRTKRDAHGNKIKGRVMQRDRDHAWFMGYAPFQHPEIALAVFVEHGGHGGKVAGPIARAIIDAYAMEHAAKHPINSAHDS
ncbi:MAG: penicillin-binding protein 2 [Mariprofundales bacterium]|nr:penicillin-binding protein 2 [Mariprofundales bacterium]